MHATREDLDYQFRLETFFAKLKHSELLEEVREKKLDELRLHFRWELLVEVKLLHNHIVVCAKRQHKAIIHLLSQAYFEFFKLRLSLDLEDHPLVYFAHPLGEKLLVTVLVYLEGGLDQND